MIVNQSEIVYVNHGEIYKSPGAMDMHLDYIPSELADPIFNFEKKDGKRYLFTSDFRKFYGKTDVPTISLDGYDLCPSVSIWACLGTKDADQKQDFDLFFAVESSQQLREVSEYYGLPYPITRQIETLIDKRPASICIGNIDGMPLIPGAIKYIDGRPAFLKLYTYPKPFGDWDVWMYGFSFYDGGKCFEKGAVYHKCTGGEDLPKANMRGKLSFKKAEVIYSEREDGIYTSYSFIHNGDPCLFWQGNEIDANGDVIRVKRFESSKSVQLAVAKLDRGAEFVGMDLCPAVTYWLGRSWYDDSDEQELLFAVTDGSATFDRMASYYNLPVPYSLDQKKTLNSNPELFRARHYDLLGSGLGQYVNVVVGGISFKNGQPSKLLIYTFLRQWEFKEQITFPDFRP